MTKGDILNVVNKEHEPNPFEESFSAVSIKFKSYTIPSHYHNNKHTESINALHMPGTPFNSINNQNQSKKKPKRNQIVYQDEEKRKSFLERNRIAALKCRQRKRQWLLDLQERLEYLTNDNDQLQLEIQALRGEIYDLRSLLSAHKHCSQYIDESKQFSTFLLQ